MELKELKIDNITKDKRTQPRAVIDDYVVGEYRADMLVGDDFPPVMVFSDNDRYYLADGWHRLFAAEQAGKQTIKAVIKNGTIRDAILYSCGVNADHGKRRTNGDKQRAVKKMLGDPEWSQWSDSKIAKVCRVTHPTVASIRKTILKNLQDKTERMVERGDVIYTMNTSNIGKSNDDQKPAIPPLIPDEEPQEQKPKYDPLNYRLFVAPVGGLSAHIEPDSIDAIITDPPYPKEYIYCYEQLAEQAKIILKPRGVLITLAGHPYIDTLIELMKPHLHYHWIGCYYMPTGQHASLPFYSVSVYWKPLLIFSRGQWDKTLTFKDVIINDDADKQYHEWGQGISGFIRLVQAFSKPNSTILDPFVGGGTTAIAALETGRYFIGSDISEEEIEKTRGRLS